MTPQVSVLLPVRNGLPWLVEALDSLSRQTFRDIEILALEDGSVDGTRALLESWPDDRMRIISTRGVGIAAALNAGLREARGSFIARHDADDVSEADRLAAQVAFLRARADVGVLGSLAEYIDRDGRAVENDWVATVRRQQDVAVEPPQIRALMPLTCCITHGSVMARRGVLRGAGGYRVDAVPAEDYDLWLRLLPVTSIAKVPRRLYRYRMHEGQVAVTRRDAQLCQTLVAKLRYIRRLLPDLPVPARLVVAGSGRGAAGYRAVASRCGFALVPPPPPLAFERLALLDEPVVRRWMLESCDVIVVPDFGTVDAYAAAFGDEVERAGNFFVPARLARRWAA